MKSAHQIFEYLTAFAVIVLFSAVILFFPEMGARDLHRQVSDANAPVTVKQPAAVTPEIETDNQTNS